ncbi:MAG: carboxylesterase family protein [Dehalococcoidia bacterium]|nr:carboxylesterase family protein [Dehalococcoidia bacterium]
MKKTAVIFIPLVILALCICTVGCGSGDIAPAPTLSIWTGDETVQSLFGPVKGFEDEGGTWLWKAIPYAKSPVGPLRWKAPQDPDPWSTVREETEFCSECPQYDIAGSILGNEDCLYLNIWRPQSDEQDLPVYFWIHGGGNSAGSASDEGCNGSNVAGKSNMVVVTVNYRLGPLGWFTHSALRGGQPGDELDDSGDYGTLDLIKALTWVQENIEAFGGDPDNVTIAGESAGGINVFSLLISPLAEDLFHKAIAQSGIPITSTFAEGEKSARAVILKLLVNDGTAADRTTAESYLNGMSGKEIEVYLRAKTPDELLAGYESLSFSMIAFPFIFEDGIVIPDTGFATIEAGTYPNKVPVIIGSNKEETKLFLFMDPSFIGKDEQYQIVASYTSDLWKAIGVDEVARKLRANDDQPDVYVYQFLWGAGGDAGESLIPDPWGFKIGAGHGLDVPFFFGNDGLFGPLTPLIFTEENRAGREALSDAMMTYVARFARTGDPNSSEAGLSEWTPWSNLAGEPKCILLDADKNDTRIAMSDLELTEAEIKAAMASDVLEPLDSESLQFLLNFVERFWGADLGELLSPD